VFCDYDEPSLHLGIIIDDNYQADIEEDQTLKLKELVLKSLNDIIDINGITLTSTTDELFNPFKSVEINYKNKIIRIMGELHPRVLRDNKFIRLDKIKTKLYYAEINLEKVI
jgi:phenylalanyl-tRNA synthetase beta subunit